MTVLARLLYIWIRNAQINKFLADAHRARQIQHEVLLAKLRRHQHSAFGREHGFSRIKSVADFRRQVPLSDYEYHRPYIERVKQGDLGAMFSPNTNLLMFALTSGTTSEAKYIPVTQEFFDEYRRGWNMWGVRTFVDHLDLVRKKTLQLSSDWQQFLTPGGTPCGNISGLAAETAPLVSRPIFIIPRSLIKITDTCSKQYTALRLSMVSPRVGMIISANPSTLVEFARLADARRESLVRDIFDGTLSADVELPGEVRQKLGRRLRRRDADRARQLEKIIEQTGTLHPRDFWPEMSVLAVWTGGSVGAYLPRLSDYYGQRILRDHGLSASEGRMTVPFQDGTSAGILDYITHYFEFVPEAEHGRPNATVLEAHELEEGQNYYIVLTTSSGLYRYDIHDLVRCVGFEGAAPVLEFLNKGASFSSITGEKLSEFQVVAAVKSGFEDLGLAIEQFTVAPVFGDPPGYILLLEESPAGQAGQELARRVDTHLARLNCEYANRLQTRRLQPLTIQIIEHGVWAALREKRTSQLGGSLEQYKHPCLVHDLQFIDQLHSLALPKTPVDSRSRRHASPIGGRLPGTLPDRLGIPEYAGRPRR